MAQSLINSSPFLFSPIPKKHSLPATSHSGEVSVLVKRPSDLGLSTLSDITLMDIPTDKVFISEQSPTKRALTATPIENVCFSEQPPTKRALMQTVPSQSTIHGQKDIDSEPIGLPETETINVKPSQTFIPSPSPIVVRESFNRLFGPEFSKIQFKQGSLGNCYLVAVFDALIHHPAGEKLMRKIKIETIRDDQNRVKTYRITFPSNRLDGNVVEFPASEFGPDRYRYKLLCGPPGLRILELAYMKMVRSTRNKMREEPFPDDGIGHTPLLIDGGRPEFALSDMFGGENLHITPRHYAKPGTQILPTDTLSASDEAVQTAKDSLACFVASKNNHYFLCAGTPPAASPFKNSFEVQLQRGHKIVTKTFKNQHTYSIRNYDLAHKTITLANPHDTAHDVFTLTRDEFFQIFRSISGIRIPKNSLATSI